MTAIDQKLHPGCWFIFFRETKSGRFDPKYYDNDEEVMKCRYKYAADKLLPGQGVRFYGPDRKLIEEKELDKLPEPATVEP